MRLAVIAPEDGKGQRGSEDYLEAASLCGTVAKDRIYLYFQTLDHDK